MAQKAKFTDFIPMQQQLIALRDENERLKEGMADLATTLNKTAELQVADLLEQITQLKEQLSSEQKLSDTLMNAIDKAEFDYLSWNINDAKLMDNAKELYTAARMN